MNNDELRKLAEAATPGPWIAAGPSFGAALPVYCEEIVVDREGDDDDGYTVCRAPLGLEKEVTSDMDFIASANPANIIELLDTIEQQQKTLVFVERWACHHGAKPHMTAEQALSCIQHYLPIKAITKSYMDGMVPDTYDPYAVIEQQRTLLEQALNSMQAAVHFRATGLGRPPEQTCLQEIEEISNHLRQQEGEKK